ncbi:MAG TPA: hypothetical protein PKA63_02385 [Oligoflexia bacterium]|nr:hypothetical protein [Oligoflexia bacterium]HMP47499.1 hypothetical protein [Oligoflexia bacterium]
MASALLSINTYQRGDRVIVQYYSLNKNSEDCTCPECGWQGSLRTDSSREISCIEVLCPRCSSALAMISSRLPNDYSGIRFI